MSGQVSRGSPDEYQADEQAGVAICPWDFPGKNHGVGCYFLLQGIFPTQGSNPRLLLGRSGSVPLSHLGRHFTTGSVVKNPPASAG